VGFPFPFEVYGESLLGSSRLRQNSSVRTGPGGLRRNLSSSGFFHARSPLPPFSHTLGRAHCLTPASPCPRFCLFCFHVDFGYCSPNAFCPPVSCEVFFHIPLFFPTDFNPLRVPSSFVAIALAFFSPSPSRYV